MTEKVNEPSLFFNVNHLFYYNFDFIIILTLSTIFFRINFIRCNIFHI
jgi:hypothetical protein